MRKFFEALSRIFAAIAWPSEEVATEVGQAFADAEQELTGEVVHFAAYVEHPAEQTAAPAETTTVAPPETAQAPAATTETPAEVIQHDPAVPGGGVTATETATVDETAAAPPTAEELDAFRAWQAAGSPSA